MALHGTTRTASCRTPGSARSTSLSTAQSVTITPRLRSVSGHLCAVDTTEHARCWCAPLISAPDCMSQEEKAEQLVSALREHVGASEIAKLCSPQYRQLETPGLWLCVCRAVQISFGRGRASAVRCNSHHIVPRLRSALKRMDPRRAD